MNPNGGAVVESSPTLSKPTKGLAPGGVTARGDYGALIAGGSRKAQTSVSVPNSGWAALGDHLEARVVRGRGVEDSCPRERCAKLR